MTAAYEDFPGYDPQSLRIAVTDTIKGVCADNAELAAVYMPDDIGDPQTVTVLAGKVEPLDIIGRTFYPDQILAVVVRTTLKGSEKTCSADVLPIPGPAHAYNYNLIDVGPMADLDQETAANDNWLMQMLQRTKFNAATAKHILNAMFHRFEYVIGGIVVQIATENLPDRPA
jgi:hypothetical protein